MFDTQKNNILLIHIEINWNTTKRPIFLTVFAYICLICPVGVGGPSWEQLRSTHWSAHQRRTRSIISNLIKFAIPRESIQLDDQYHDLNGHHNWVCIKYAIKRFTTNHSNQINTDSNNKYLMSRGEMAMKYFYYILPDSMSSAVRVHAPCVLLRLPPLYYFLCIWRDRIYIMKCPLYFCLFYSASFVKYQKLVCVLDPNH